MSINYAQDMTEGNVVKHLIQFSLPMLIGNIFQQFYNIIDSIVVGKIHRCRCIWRQWALQAL